MTEQQQLLRLLLMLQAAVFAVGIAEAFLLGAPPAGAFAAIASLSLWYGASRVGRQSKGAIRMVRYVERIILAVAAINTAFAIFLTRSLLAPVSLFTQVVLPIAVLALIRKITATPLPPALPKELTHGAH